MKSAALVQFARSLRDRNRDLGHLWCDADRLRCRVRHPERVTLTLKLIACVASSIRRAGPGVAGGGDSAHPLSPPTKQTQRSQACSQQRQGGRNRRSSRNRSIAGNI
jgi:hypothetical protein